MINSLVHRATPLTWVLVSAATFSVLLALLAVLVVPLFESTVNDRSSQPPPLSPAVDVSLGAPKAEMPYVTLAPEMVAALPAATYDAVIAGLLPAPKVENGSITQAFTARAELPVYGAEGKEAVAKISPLDFLGQPQVIVPIKTEGAWALVFTAARIRLPSMSNGVAPSQSAGWVRTDALQPSHDLTSWVEVSVAAQQLTIHTGNTSITYPVGVGAPETPTPTNVTGFIQERYLDVAQGAVDLPIQLTTLHSAVADNPFGGSDGGLVGIHFNETATGQVSHGCIRGNFQTIAAVSQLPLGTPVTVNP